MVGRDCYDARPGCPEDRVLTEGPGASRVPQSEGPCAEQAPMGNYLNECLNGASRIAKLLDLLEQRLFSVLAPRDEKQQCEKSQPKEPLAPVLEAMENVIKMQALCNEKIETLLRNLVL